MAASNNQRRDLLGGLTAKTPRTPEEVFLVFLSDALGSAKRLGDLGVLYVPHTQEDNSLTVAVEKRGARGETENLWGCGEGGVVGETDYAAAARLRLGLEDRRQAWGAAV